MFHSTQTPCPTTDHPAVAENADTEWRNAPAPLHDQPPALTLARQKMIRKMWKQYAASHMMLR